MKKGFTLIELLAVIVILSVIALVATVGAINIIEEAKNKADRNSVYGILDAAKLYYSESTLDSDKKNNVNGATNLMDKITLSGDKPNIGEVYVNNDGKIAIAVVYNDICYKKEFEDSQLTENEDISNCKVTTATLPVEPYYVFGTISESGSQKYQDVIANSGSNVFVKVDGEELSLCIYRNNTLECFKNNNYEEESEYLQNLFGSDICDSDDSQINCYDDNFDCLFDNSGYVDCYDNDSGHNCKVTAEGNVSCN